MDGQLPLDTIDLDAIINETIKPAIISVVDALSSVGFTLGDIYFTFWDFLLVVFVVDVICLAMYFVRTHKDKGG